MIVTNKAIGFGHGAFEITNYKYTPPPHPLVLQVTRTNVKCLTRSAFKNVSAPLFKLVQTLVEFGEYTEKSIERLGRLWEGIKSTLLCTGSQKTV